MPSFDSDGQIREAAFAALRSLAGLQDGVVTREQMTAGFIFEGERIPFALRRVGIWRPKQLKVPGAALSITTANVKRGAKPKYDDQIAQDGWFEYRYQGTDPTDWDNVAVRAAHQLHRPLIYFYGVGASRYEAIFPAYVVGDDPKRLTFTIAADATSLGDPSLLIGGAELPLKAYATTVVKRRLHQHRFRELVVAAYGERCTVCRLRHPELLDAAHILEDRDERGKPEVPNGLSLCKIHHGAYDANILGISPDYLIHIRTDILKEKDGPMLRHGLQEMDGLGIRVPRLAELRPRKEYLDLRFGKWKAA
jgi:putative restriction endonuclease